MLCLLAGECAWHLASSMSTDILGEESEDSTEVQESDDTDGYDGDSSAIKTHFKQP